MTSIDPGLSRIVEASERKTNFALGRLEEKTLRALKKADGVMRGQIMRADRLLYPNGHLQGTGSQHLAVRRPFTVSTS